MSTTKKRLLNAIIIVVALAAIFCIGVYVGGYWGQKLTRLIKGSYEIFYTDLRAKAVIEYAFTTLTGKILMLLTDSVLLFALLKTVAQRKRFHSSTKDPRNFEVSSTGTQA